MAKFENILERLEDFVTTSAAILMATFLLVQVFLRYLQIGSAPWTEEFARYLMIISTFFGAALASKRQVHIEVSILHLFKFRKRVLKHLQLMKTFLCFLACSLMSYLFLPAVMDSYSRGIETPSGNLPMFIPFGLVFVGLILMSVHYLLLVYRNLMKFAAKKGVQ